MMATPASDASHVVLGFEDLAGGGDRDLNDLVILVTFKSPDERLTQ
jgi:hypothetical protein